MEYTNYDNATQEQLHQVENIIQREIYCNQSLLVEELLKKEILPYDEIINCGAFKGGFDEESEAQEIFEWYCVSHWLAEELKEVREPVLMNEFGCWWGRTTTGGAIVLDSTFWNILFNKKGD